MSQETMQKMFQVASPVRLNLSNIRGLVEIGPGQADQVQVTVIKHTESGDAGNTEIELSQSADGSVVAATHFPDGWWLWLLGSKPCRVDYLVKMPQGSMLMLKGVENSVFLDGLEGEFDVTSVSGNLTLCNLTGPVRINTVSGDVSITRVSGALNLVTVSGDLDAREARLAAINAKTVSGNLTVQTLLADGPYRFDSVSGDVRLLLPAETRCNAYLHTVSGDISTTFPTTNSSRGHSAQAVEIQGGGITIDARSVSGNLRLRASADALRTASVEKTPASADRREILERLERGEMTPDEALVQLKA